MVLFFIQMFRWLAPELRLLNEEALGATMAVSCLFRLSWGSIISILLAFVEPPEAFFPCMISPLNILKRDKF